jgi:hypothetical protein
MRTRFSLKYRLKVEGWRKMLKEMRKFWLEGEETTLETSYFNYFEWSNALENRIAKRR